MRKSKKAEKTQEKPKENKKSMFGFNSLVEFFIMSLIKKIPNEVLISYMENGGRAIIDGIKSFPGQAAFIKQLAKPFLNYLPQLTPETVIEYLKKHDTEKAGIILNHRKGYSFLKETLDDIKLWLVSNDVLCEACGNPFPDFLIKYSNAECPYCGAKYKEEGSDRAEQ